jgi:hypothetical protein
MDPELLDMVWPDFGRDLGVRGVLPSGVQLEVAGRALDEILGDHNMCIANSIVLPVASAEASEVRVYL